ncbi:reverse transcriptase domain-containing protein [Tanacetum coccineum]
MEELLLERFETMQHEIDGAYTSVEAAKEEIDTLQAELGAARERIPDLKFCLEDTETRVEASKAREIRLGARVRALEDRFRPPGERHGNGMQNEDSGSAGGVEYTPCGCSYKEFLNWTDIVGYTKRFQKLALLCPGMVIHEYKKVERYIWGLTPDIRGNVTSSKPTKIQEAIRMAHDLTDQQPNKRQDVVRAYTARPSDMKEGYAGKAPLCNRCKLNHIGPCIVQSNNCKRIGHQTRDSRTPTLAKTQRPLVTSQITSSTCFECGVQGHYKSECPKLKNQNRGNQNESGGARRRAFVLRGGEAIQDPNIVTGTYLLNNRYTSVLFDTSVDRSLVSTAFSSLIDVTPTALDIKYIIELANRKLKGADTIIRECTMNLVNHRFNIDLMPHRTWKF